MSSTLALPSRPRQLPVLADLAGRSRALEVALVVAGAAWVAALGQVAIPLGFTPIPLSLGTFAVLTAGAALGPARGAAAMILFAAAGCAGAPVFAGGLSGIGLPTMGYVLGYVVAAGLAGRAARGGLDRSPGRAFVVMAAASAAIYLLGVPYLAWSAGLSLAQAAVQGMLPFLVGDLIKAAAAAALVPALGRAASASLRQPEL
jgi:biotin transport system substrate-specific component